MLDFLRKTLAGIGLFIGVLLLIFSYVCWLSPTARLGKRNEQLSYLVQPGMTTSQAVQVLGQPIEKRIFTTGRTVYIYQTHSFASDDISFSVDSTNTILSVNHGE